MKSYLYLFLSVLVTAASVFYAKWSSPSSLGTMYSFSTSMSFVPVSQIETELTV